MARALLLAGAAGLVLSALLPWITVSGIGLDLGAIDVQVAPGARTVTGMNTSVWPLLFAIAVVVAVLTVRKAARGVLIASGLLATVVGGGLLYYVSNAVEIEGKDARAIEQLVTEAVITTSTGPGTPLLLASGIAILVGALLAR